MAPGEMSLERAGPRPAGEVPADVDDHGRGGLASHSASRSSETSGDRSNSIAAEAIVPVTWAHPGRGATSREIDAATRRLAPVPQPSHRNSLAAGLALLVPGVARELPRPRH